MPVTPVSTSRDGVPERTAEAMSVSSRSPTISGERAPARRTDSSCSARSGLPATRGTAPVAVRSIATSEPLPGSRPRSVGTEASVLLATHSAPAWIASAASASRA